MGCNSIFARSIKETLKKFDLEITNEIDTGDGCVINFRDKDIQSVVSKIVSQSEAIYDTTASIAVTDNGDIEMNIPLPVPRGSHAEWKIETPDGKLIVPHVYVRDKYAVFGLKGNVTLENFLNALNSLISIKSNLNKFK